MARVTVFTRWFEFWVGVVCPYVSRLHASLAVLAVGDGVARYALHPGHFPHTTAWVFNEIISGVEFFYEFQHMDICVIAEFRIVTDGIEISSMRVLSPVVADGGYRECTTIGARPDNIRVTECVYNLLRSQCGDVCIQVDVLKVLIPFDAVDLMTASFECLSDASSSRE